MWISKLKKKAIIQDYETRIRLTDDAIAERYGIHPRTVQKILKKHRERKERMVKWEEESRRYQDSRKDAGNCSRSTSGEMPQMKAERFLATPAES